MSRGAPTRRVETFSYLPPLTDDEIGKQVDWILTRGLVPAIEYTLHPRPRDSYWSMWKLPLFEARTGAEVLGEIASCLDANPESYVKVVGYDPRLQSQVVSLVVRRPQRDDNDDATGRAPGGAGAR
jgi:ribulose-bisphosphate carboxylase small chain